MRTTVCPALGIRQDKSVLRDGTSVPRTGTGWPFGRVAHAAVMLRAWPKRRTLPPWHWAARVVKRLPRSSARKNVKRRRGEQPARDGTSKRNSEREGQGARTGEHMKTNRGWRAPSSGRRQVRFSGPRPPESAVVASLAPVLFAGHWGKGPDRWSYPDSTLQPKKSQRRSAGRRVCRAVERCPIPY